MHSNLLIVGLITVLLSVIYRIFESSRYKKQPKKLGYRRSILGLASAGFLFLIALSLSLHSYFTTGKVHWLIPVLLLIYITMQALRVLKLEKTYREEEYRQGIQNKTIEPTIHSSGVSGEAKHD